VRVIFVLLACFSGVGLILYVVLWVAAPEEPLMLQTAATYPPPANPQV
jgi:phage shock protein PspC (stress-responsive transcriptional regulator)